MDPDATLARIIDAAIAGDYDELDAAAKDLSDWLESGGFAPREPRSAR